MLKIVAFLVYLIFSQAYANVGGEDSMFYPIRFRSSWQCFGGGYSFNSKVYSISYTKPELEMASDGSGQSNCKQSRLSEEIGSLYLEKKNVVDELVKSWRFEDMSVKPGCFDVKVTLQKFLNSAQLVEELNSKYNDDRIAAIKKTAKNNDFQSDYSLMGYASALCNGSHVVERNQVYWYLLVDLIRRSKRGPIEKVTTNGATIEDCSNIIALGSDHINSFFVKMDKAKTDEVLFSFFHQGDKNFKTKITSGSETLFDSGCYGSPHRIEEAVKINKSVYSTVRVEIDHDCLKNNPNHEGPWDIQLSCQNQPQNDGCQEKLTKLISALKDFLAQSNSILDHYWQQSTCFEQIALRNKAAKEFLTNFDSKKSYNFTYSTSNVPVSYAPPTTEKLKTEEELILDSLDDKSTFISLADREFKEDEEEVSPLLEPTAGPEQEKTTESTETNSVNRGMHATGIKEFVENKGFFCGTRPEKKLFGIISWAYCYYGIERLY